MNDSLTELLVSLELRLLDPEVRRNPAAVSPSLAESFIEFGSSGRVYTKSEILVELEAEAPSETESFNFDTRVLAPGVALLTYRTTTDGGEALRSSVWVESAGGWQMVFHQGTPC